MDRLKKQFVMLLVPAVLILFAAFLAAQGPPGPCLNACALAYKNAVNDCHGDKACLAQAQATALLCAQGCGLPPQ